MTLARVMSPAPTPFNNSSARSSRANRSLLIAIAVFLAVLIVDAIIIAAAAPSIAALGSLYTTST